MIHHYGLDRENIILFSQEYHIENRLDLTFANGGLNLFGNNPQGLNLFGN